MRSNQRTWYVQAIVISNHSSRIPSMEYLDKEELRRLFQAAYDSNPIHHLFLVTTLWHGLRVSEAINIKGIDVRDGKLKFRRLKKSLPTNQPIHRDFDPLFDETPLIALAKDNPRGKLFDFSRQRADQFIRKYGEMAGIDPAKCHVHALKHSIAMLVWEKTSSLGNIQTYLGHKSASSTLIYLREVDEHKAFAAVAKITI
jgi:integrase/recombinase XerD